jgi:hypothetical protein
MAGGAFLLLKAGDSRPESSKQAEIRLAKLLKIVHIRLFWRRKALAGGLGTCNGCICSEFGWIWLIRRRAVSLVIQVTVFVKKLAQCPAWECRSKLL